MEKFGEDKAWSTMAFIVEENGEYKIEFSYEIPDWDLGQERDWLVETYLNSKYIQYKGFYPSTEIEFMVK